MLPCFIHNQNAILHVKVMVKCSKKLVTKNVTKLWKMSKMGWGGGGFSVKNKNQKVQNSKCRLLFDEGGGSELFPKLK